jgi:hypothetical protein
MMGASPPFSGQDVSHLPCAEKQKACFKSRLF